MPSSQSDFKQAIASYRFPGSEPICYLDLNGRLGDSRYPHDPCLFVFRSAGPEAGWHKTVEEFWASALFNFIEDCLNDPSFEKLGAIGEYRALSKDEASRRLGDL